VDADRGSQPAAPALDRLAAAFLEGTLPKAAWTHEAHLRVGVWHLLRFPPSEALDRLREGIRRYNEATGTANSAHAGYHETITRFYVRVIGGFIAAADRSRPADALADDLVAQLGDRALPLCHWSAERLMSPEARRGWVEPDREPLA
jgi:hypothetical protein